MKIGSKEYDEWLNNPLTKALKQSFERAVTDPENQPSQYGTVTLEMYEALEKQRDELLAAAQQAANVTRKCDYTPARSTLLAAINSVKGGAA